MPLKVEEVADRIRSAHERGSEEAAEAFCSLMTEKVEFVSTSPEQGAGIMDSAKAMELRKAEIRATRAALPEYKETLDLTVEKDVLNCVFTVTGRPPEGPLSFVVKAQYWVKDGQIYKVAMDFKPEDSARMFALMSKGGFEMPPVESRS